MLYRWTIEVHVKQCSLNLNSNSLYALSMRVGNKLSEMSSHKKPHGSILHFDTILKIQIDTKTNYPPENKISIILNMITSDHRKKSQEQHIIGIASICQLEKIVARSSKSISQEFKIYIFSQCLDKQAYIRAYPKVICEEIAINSHPNMIKQEQSEAKSFSAKIKKEIQETDNTQQLQMLKDLLLIQEKKNTELNKFIGVMMKMLESNTETKTMFESTSIQTTIQHHPIDQKQQKSTQIVSQHNQEYENLVKERDQLYEISQQLYKELKTVKEQRDEYLMELREKQLNFEHLKFELSTCKEALQQKEQINIEERRALHETPSKQLTSLIKQNDNLIKQNELLNSKIKELQRKVKECFKAIQQFKNDALSARSEIIIKEGQILMLKNSKNGNQFDSTNSSPKKIDSQQNEKNNNLIQTLLQEIANKNKNIQKINEYLCKNNQVTSQKYEIGEQKLCLIKKEIAKLYSNLLKNVKIFKDRQLLIKEKIQFQTNCEQILKN